MFKLLKADFYKLFRSASFYICAAFVAIFSVLGVIGVYLYFEGMGFEPKMVTQFISSVEFFAYTFGTSLANIPTLAVIVFSIFTVKDFSSGIIKNTISRGHSRIYYYLSKFLVNTLVAIMYTLLAFVVVMIMNSIIFGLGDMSKDAYVEILIALGKYLIFLLPIVGISTMFAFLFRNIAASIILSILLLTKGITDILFTIIDWLVVDQMKLSETYTTAKYWPVTYLSITEKAFSDPDMIKGLIVCASWLVLSLVVGLWTFKKRDIK